MTKAMLARLRRNRACTYEGSMYEGRTLRVGEYVTLRVKDFDTLMAAAGVQR